MVCWCVNVNSPLALTRPPTSGQPEESQTLLAKLNQALQLTGLGVGIAQPPRSLTAAAIFK